MRLLPRLLFSQPVLLGLALTVWLFIFESRHGLVLRNARPALIRLSSGMHDRIPQAANDESV